jgi:hypothetical protein
MTYKDHFGLFDPWIWDRQVDPKHPYRIITLRCVMPQKSADFIYVAVEAWNQSHLIQWVPGAFFPGVKAAGAWGWPFTSIQCQGYKKKWIYTCPPAVCLYGVDRDKFTFTFTDYRVMYKVKERYQQIKRVGQKISLLHILVSLFSPVLRTGQIWLYCYPTTVRFFRCRPEHGSFTAQKAFQPPGLTATAGAAVRRTVIKKRPVFFHILPSELGIYRTPGQAFLFPVDISPCPVLSAILSQLFAPRDRL